jgi:nitrate reductase NapAB chaperone NapD
MNICSYLLHIHNGGNRDGSLTRQLNALPGCEATPAENEENLMILVTETPDKAADEQLCKQIESITAIEGMALVFGAQNPEERTAS